MSNFNQEEFKTLSDLVKDDPQWIKDILSGRTCVCTDPQHGGKIFQCGSIYCEIREVLQSD